MSVCKICDRHTFRIFFRRSVKTLIAIAFVLALILALGKGYQISDRDPERGAIPINNGAMSEDYKTPVYLSQSWDNADSLWFYNTTQGSDLIPYDFFMVLEKIDSVCPSPATIDMDSDASQCLFRANDNIDLYRYLPQKKTRFNPDSLPVGFVKDSYDGMDYVGYTCAACHTGQVNYQQQAIRIDGGPAMANMVNFLTDLENTLRATLNDTDKRNRFIKNVLHRHDKDTFTSAGGNYDSADTIKKDLEMWTNRIALYNTINHSTTDYGYARLDAFGRIYNRVLEHVINKEQAITHMAMVKKPNSNDSLLSTAEINKVVEGLNDIVLGEAGFEKIITRLQSHQPGYPALSDDELLLVREEIFNEPNAPVSYPFLWDISQSDYVQWNGLASNAGIGPLGRNTGEVIGVFGKLDWSEDKPSLANLFHLNLAASISGQKSKRHYINFKSSIDKVNLKRLESHLRELQSPKWPDGCNNLESNEQLFDCYATPKGQRNVQLDDDERPQDILPDIDLVKAKKGRFIYAQYCQSCHEIIDRSDWDRKVIGKMMSVDVINTDPKMALNSVNYRGSAGNFKHIYQDTDAGPVILEENAPVVQILTAATRGVIATRDYDKMFLRRWADWLYALVGSIFDNNIKASVKVGDYQADTTAQPYASLVAYKARSLNGIWATAPYLHNGSVPTLYDLLLPRKNPNDPEFDAQGVAIEYRPDEFLIGSREFDPVRVGFKSSGYQGFNFQTSITGNANTGHEYAAGRTPPLGENNPLPALNKAQRMQLLEFIKTL
ncbi:MAG: di-heme-cytochrome C peroxidase [Pseudomonadales bacterium]